MSISNEDKLSFLISISKGKLAPTTLYIEAFNYWYNKPNCTDLYEAAVKIAFTTLARTVHGIQNNPQRDSMKTEASDYLISRLKNIPTANQQEFDTWHQETSENLIKIFSEHNQNFTFGQAQKWINMSLKHLSLADFNIVKNYYAFCHVPIDSYIIEGLKTPLVGKEMNQIDTSFDENHQENIPWSRIDNYTLYLNFQKDFREKCGEIPLDYEFHLWQKQKDSINER